MTTILVILCVLAVIALVYTVVLVVKVLKLKKDKMVVTNIVILLISIAMLLTNFSYFLTVVDQAKKTFASTVIINGTSFIAAVFILMAITFDVYRWSAFLIGTLSKRKKSKNVFLKQHKVAIGCLLVVEIVLLCVAVITVAVWSTISDYSGVLKSMLNLVLILFSLAFVFLSFVGTTLIYRMTVYYNDLFKEERKKVSVHFNSKILIRFLICDFALLARIIMDTSTSIPSV